MIWAVPAAFEPRCREPSLVGVPRSMTGTCAPWVAKAAWQANVLALAACSSRVA